jgi:hypothetical protein
MLLLTIIASQTSSVKIKKRGSGLTEKVELHRACDHKWLVAAGTIHFTAAPQPACQLGACLALTSGVSSNDLLVRTPPAI